ncbi:hypothetical protein ACIBG5_10715 [Kribbella sp. NPDC050241]|uniref:hypothetical protein n=1 Tax=Kribbella sp. NPDC050241 TaxID=3364115 RepID=UPI00378F2271
MTGMSLVDLHNSAYAQLIDPSCPRYAVIQTPTGTGIRRVLETLIGEIATSRRVLVLTERGVVAEQWRHRLEADGGFAVTHLATAEVALRLLEATPDKQGAGEILTSTTSRALRGPIARVLAELDFGLIVYDDASVMTLGSLQSLNDRAQRVVLLASHHTAPPGWPIVVDVRLPELEAVLGRRLFEPVPYTLGQTERDLERDVGRLLYDYAADFPQTRERTPRRGLAGLHEVLLDVAAELQAVPASSGSVDSTSRHLLRRIWQLVEQVEAASVIDARLSALDEAIVIELSRGQRCVVMAVEAADVSYVVAHLVAVGRAPVASLTEATDLTERQGALETLGPGELVIGTVAVASDLDRVHVPYTIILWSQAALVHVLDRLDGGDDVRILSLVEEGGRPAVSD